MPQLTQLNRLARIFPVSAAPSFGTLPYAVADVQVGDSSHAVLPTALGFPTPGVVATIVMSDGTVHPHPYVFGSADVGKTATPTFTATSALGTSVTTGTPFTVQPVVSAENSNLIGSNTTSVKDYTPACFLNNAGQQGRLFWVTGTQNTGVPVDANGWPTTAFDYLLTSVINGFDGQLPHGTYQCSYRSVGQATTISALANCTISNIVQDPDGVTTHFLLVTNAASNVELRFSGAVQYIDVPRDGVTPTYGGPEFYAPAVAHFASMSTFRTMDIANINYRQNEVNWTDRVPEYGVTAPFFPFSWERIIRFINAVKAYPGSQLKSVHFNTPGFVTPAYCATLAGLINSLVSPGISFRIGYGNEQWNFSAPAPTYYSLNLAAAQTEAQTVAGWLVSGNANYGGNAGGSVPINNIASVSRVGNVVTVVTTTALQSFIVNGATPVVCNLSDSTWNASNLGATGNAANPVTNFQVLSSTSFSYTQPQTAADATLTSSTGKNLVFYFNTASTLVADGSYDLNQIYLKYYVRNLFNCSNAWRAVRPQDTWCLEFQQQGNLGWQVFFGVGSNDPFFVKYANWLAVQAHGAGSNLSSFVDSISCAPYTRLTPQYGSIAAGATQVLGVPFAANYKPGDPIIVTGAGTSGASLSTTVGTGSIGTTLNITTAASTAVSNGQIKPVVGVSNQTIVAMWMGYADSYNMQAMLLQAYVSTKYGLRSIAYEGANEAATDDVSLTDAQVTSLMAYSGVAANLTHLMDNWFQTGNDEFYAFSAAPGLPDDQYNFQLQGTWGDSTSPKMAALLAYTGARTYWNLNSDTFGGATCYAKNAIATNAGLSTANAAYPTTSASGGVLNWPSNNVDRYVDWGIVVPRAGKYQVIITACDSAVGTQAHISLDTFATDVGTLGVLGSGSGDSATSAPADSTDTLIVNFATRGRHNIRVHFPATDGVTGIRPGVTKVRVVPYAAPIAWDDTQTWNDSNTWTD